MFYEFILYALTIIYTARLISYGVYCIKNKKEGAPALFILSGILLATPLTSAIVNLLF